MSESVRIVAIIAIAVIVVLLMFRERLRNFMIKANKDGIEANLDAGKPAGQAQSRGGGVNISGNKMIGNKNKIDVGRSNVNVEKNLQKGNNQEIVVRPQKTTSKSKSKSKPATKKKR